MLKMLKKSKGLVLWTLVFIVVVVSYCGVRKTQGATEFITENVNTVEQLKSAIEKAKPGTTILLEDGVYNDIKLNVKVSGDKDNLLIIKAKNEGKVTFSGDVKVEISGDYIVLEGIYFKDGDRNLKEWKSHGIGLVAIYGDHNRITECAFNNFDKAESAWITTSIRPSDKHVPQYNRIDHCSFTDKVTNDQVINLNNSKDKNGNGTPMYNRIDHCYFSNPQKFGNAGGAIRIGYSLNDDGRCLVDTNLFERQDSEPEIVTSKSKQNIYLNNTIKNCQGTLNFRHGSNQVAIGNYYIGNDNKFQYGGMFIWGSGHVIANNYFSLSKTIKSRGSAAIFLNPGIPDDEFSLAENTTIANNVFAENNGYAINFDALYDRRVEYYEKQGKEVQLPHDNTIINNVFLGNQKKYKYTTFENQFPLIDRKDTFKNNIMFGAQMGYEILSGIEEKDPELRKDSDGIYRFENENPTMNDEVDFKVNDIEGIENIPGLESKLDLTKLAHKSVFENKPLQFNEVGPHWMSENPSQYAEKGVVSEEISAYLEQVKKEAQMKKQ